MPGVETRRAAAALRFDFGGEEFGSDFPGEAVVPGEAEDVVNVARLAEGHEFLDGAAGRIGVAGTEHGGQRGGDMLPFSWKLSFVTFDFRAWWSSG